jgi:hypothetical protein
MASPLILGHTLTPIVENEFKRYLPRGEEFRFYGIRWFVVFSCAIPPRSVALIFFTRFVISHFLEDFVERVSICP